MPYSIKSDIQNEISDEQLIQLTDDNDTGLMDDAKITEAIAKADEIIDSYCGKVADVPFTTVPGVIKQHSKTIAIYFLFGRRNAVPENRKDDYTNAIAHLKDISTGKATLPSVNDAGSDGDEVMASGSDEDRIFKMGKASDGSTGSLDNY